MKSKENVTYAKKYFVWMQTIKTTKIEERLKHLQFKI